MQAVSLESERKRAVFAVVMTALWMPALVAVFIQGPQWLVLFMALAFMAGYLVERVCLYRTIASLLRPKERPRTAGAFGSDNSA